MAIFATTTLPPSLISPARANLSTQLAALPANQVTTLLNAATNAIRRLCRRNFSQMSYQGYFSGGAYPFDTLYLPEIPIISVSRLATNPTVVLTVQNTDSNTNQRATVATSTTGITLIRIASAVQDTQTATWSAYPTVQSLANWINGLGNGWRANINSGYALYPSADFKPMQGATSAMGGTGAGLEQYLETPTFSGSGIFYDGASPWSTGSGWRLDQNKGIIWGQFPPGGGNGVAGNPNIRVDWTSGFCETPDAVQEACVITATALARAEQVNYALSSVKLGNTSAEINMKGVAIPPPAMALLGMYIDYAGTRV